MTASSASAGERHVEIERKFDVPGAAALPDLTTIDVVAHAVAPEPAHLDAVYYDTPALTLIHAKVALRRRTGGHDAGWHVKTTGEHGRIERHWPIDPAAPDEIPAGALRLVEVWAKPDELAPVARIQTTRTATELSDAEQRPLAEIADDEVRTTDLRDGTVRQWHEWEAELAERLDDAPDSPGALLLRVVSEHLIAAGARPSSAVAKLQRALGLDRGAHATAAQAVAHIAQGLAADLDARLDDAIADRPDGVHQARIVIRRLRSLLDVYGVFVDPSVVRAARRRLKRLGDDLGAARDAEVRARDAERQVLQLQGVPAAKRLVGRLSEPAWRVYAAAHAQLTADLTDRRRSDIADQLHRLTAPEAASPEGQADAVPALRAQLAEAVASLVVDDHRLVEIWEQLHTPGAGARARLRFEHALHEVRKDGRRIRYATEAVSLGLSDTPLQVLERADAKRLAKAAKRLQDLLGDHRDDSLFADHVLHVAADDERARSTQRAALPYYLLALHARERGAEALGRYGETRDELLAAAKVVLDF
ncbi:CYTH and CHAD domain-containing protein [Pseudoclavibacter sp. 13-3]|uniref:CYTH and CHAD domain-containing protein n=1 Tax=Pseudoclavibacter sp. 13-3 TaxID=2901228 RepID=UPI001E44F9F9|nr:CYTH and CHAD domain-containing protein [Pseudoclavibacter sp. 13-3]MCD7101420.1 CYTH and CHAD domain-containing protein [Pseudoclavibacter sp. 13-3]